MKEDINIILNYLECDNHTFLLRNWILSIDSSNRDHLAMAANQLLDAIKQFNILDIRQIGVYYLFLGCVYYDQDYHQDGVKYLQKAINYLSGATINKSLTHWLLGLSYHNIENFPKAHWELQEARRLLEINVSENTLRINIEYRKRREIRNEIQNVLERLSGDPLFRTVQPAPTQSADPSPAQNPSVGRNDAEQDKSQANPATSSSSKTQEKENFNYRETHTGGNVSFQFIQTILPASTQSANFASTEIPGKENGIPFVEETRTDGYILFQSLPVYEQKVAASKTGEPEIGLNEVGFAEAKIIVLNNQPHELYPLKSTSNEIKIAANGKNMGWAKICGQSMNKIEKKTSIADGDFVLLLFSSDADDNDIVLASFEDPQTTQSFLTVKRYRKEELILKSESSEIGPEFENINLGDLHNAKIIGIVYAVAKPI